MEFTLFELRPYIDREIKDQKTPNTYKARPCQETKDSSRNVRIMKYGDEQA